MHLQCIRLKKEIVSPALILFSQIGFQYRVFHEIFFHLQKKKKERKQECCCTFFNIFTVNRWFFIPNFQILNTLYQDSKNNFYISQIESSLPKIRSMILEEFREQRVRWLLDSIQEFNSMPVNEYQNKSPNLPQHLHNFKHEKAV